jgi:hypothetical protein
MSSTMTEERPAAAPRRTRRAANRRGYWVARLKSAGTGEQAFTDMLRWTRGELAKIRDQRPEEADATCWHLARELAVLNAALSKARYPMRVGLTAEEESALLGRPGGGQ